MFADFSQPEDIFLSLDSSMTLQAPDKVEDELEYLDFTQPEHIFVSLASSLMTPLILIFCFNNISAISWRSVLVVEEAGENHRPWARNW